VSPRKLCAAALVFLIVSATTFGKEQKGLTVLPREEMRRERAQRWAVLIGVDRYDDEAGIGSLKYCGSDMKLLYRVLTGPNGGFAPENVLLMTRDAKEPKHTPTYSHIVTLVPLWLRDAKPEDDVLVAFSGHGITERGEAYLLPSSAMRSNLRLTAIPLSLIREWMDACRAARKILIVDACHAGAGKDAPLMSEEFWSDLERGRGFIKLASCGPNQKSNEGPALESPVGRGHGVFTYYLSEGLEGAADFDRDGRIDVDEAYRYTCRKTRLWARKKGLRQDPVKSGSVSGVMSIAYYRDLEQLRRDRQAAQARLRQLGRDAAAAADDAARKALAEARHRERESLRQLDERLRMLRGTGDGGKNAFRRYLSTRAQVIAIKAELDKKRKRYTAGSGVVRALEEKLAAAQAGSARLAETVAREALAKRESLERQAGEMRKEMMPEHHRMRQITSAIRTIDRRLEAVREGLIPAWARISGQQIAEAARDAVEPTTEIDLGGGVTIKMVYIPPGSFMMGSPRSEDGRSDDEGPRHPVTLAHGFYIGIHEVTQAQWFAVTGSNPSKLDRQANPVEQVSCKDCRAFLAALRKKLPGQAFRLPTEAEWEYACRGGSATRFYYGDEERRLPGYAWYARNSNGRTHAVGQKRPNAWGLYDMSGNVWEWCQSLYRPYPYRSEDGREALRASGERVLRGGSCLHLGIGSRSANRDKASPDNRRDTHGFRIVLAPWETIEDASEIVEEKKTAAPVVPPGFTAEKKRVNVCTPEGDRRQEITIYKNSLGMALVKIPAGEFTAGSISGHHDEEPVHQVRIATSFYMGAHEVTQAQWAAVMGKNPSEFRDEKNPVERVSWHDAVEFCERLTQAEGHTYRLPSEAEWEYACRAGTRTRYYHGDEERGLGECAWHAGNAKKRPHPVAGKKPNAWGLYDMSGNVWEWCRSPYGPYPFPSLAGDALRVLRGGSWLNSPGNCRSAVRYRAQPDYRSGNLGFRVVVTVR